MMMWSIFGCSSLAAVLGDDLGEEQSVSRISRAILWWPKVRSCSSRVHLQTSASDNGTYHRDIQATAQESFSFCLHRALPNDS
jgi:hypothetical protein